ncbi:chitin synthase III catalytic subunit [Halteromyces radiatus]|uniref:chitin synthase III catalytic subunit n=1 Tax=Halteromyces radiatus TaxID=101107 RepID=UPI002220A503|nr:chitin synthase III catalytic subunit [Halteromyces radiatus]KAI8099539.1 chitin synthase III catalytic subunit [Halteromyces radiatus]
MVSLPFRFQAFKFDGICQTVALTLCPLIGKYDGIEPFCYSRNVEFAGMLIFQPATLIMDIVAICMAGVMIYHVKTKYTAVGRKEITMFFQLYLVTMLLEMLLVSSIIPTASSLYPFFTSAHLGLGSVTFWCLLLNGFVGFQFAEDGTPISLWSIRITSFAVFFIVGFVGMATFNNVGPFNCTYPIGLWVIYFIFNGACFMIYLISQLFLVAYTLDDRWPLGDIAFGVLFFLTGQVIMFIFSLPLCEQMKHYMDGLFFGTTFNLLAVMMVYKYWDSITKEDLEFSIDSKHQEWQTLLIHDDINYNEKNKI